ncbi:MAG: prepilin-type N-terminal cleavage/methylation domain-containing protein [Paucibacter sp.]|nr:prepilin-type N-terminal cleavage/methylation domain-containing protein [Roseateles sp.]
MDDQHDLLGAQFLGELQLMAPLRLPNPMGRGQGREVGFTMVELSITIAVAALLAALAAPAILAMTQNARTRSMVQKLMSDFVWVRNTSALTANATSGTVATLTINADCSWSSSVNGVANPAHSMTTATLSQNAPGLTCSATTAFPVTLNFTPQGFLTPQSPTPTVTYLSNKGQAWPLQVMTSGSVLLTQGAS